jgi:hypothetical protein
VRGSPDCARAVAVAITITTIANQTLTWSGLYHYRLNGLFPSSPPV